jgi:hypothetical protein
MKEIPLATFESLRESGEITDAAVVDSTRRITITTKYRLEGTLGEETVVAFQTINETREQ